MARSREPKAPPNKRAPARTVEARENQLVALATNLAEQQLREGTASSQVISHFLKLGSTVALLEKEKLAKENALLTAKTEALKSTERIEELYQKAIEAQRLYSGASSGGDDD